MGKGSSRGGGMVDGMDRVEAIGVLSRSVDREINEFCVGPDEHRRARLEAREAFNALGVSDVELGWDGSSF